MGKTEILSLCSGCLCADRKMALIKQFCDKQTLSQIFSDFSECIVNQQYMFCWECQAKVRKFILFKKQVNESFLKLQDYVEKEANFLSLCQQPMLQIQKISALSIDLHLVSQDTTQVKEEQQTNSIADAVKLETNSDHYDDAESIFQPEEKKKRKKKKKKKVEKSVEIKEDLMYKKLELTPNEIEKEREKLMQLEDFINAMFRCDKCIVTFPNEDDFKDHNALKHDIICKNRCAICDSGFSSEMSYNYHLNRHRVRYECCMCTDRFSTIRSVTKHFEITHTQIPMLDYNLDIKNDTIHETTDNIVDAKTNTTQCTFSCEFCDKSFKWKASLRKHSETHRIETGQKRKPYCEPCRLSFSTTSNLQKHVKMSTKHQLQLKLRKLKESNPDEIQEKDKIKQLHNSLSKGRELYQCSQCDKKFQWRGNLLRHMLSHQHRSKRDLVCEPCNRTFSSLATYKQHMKISKKHVSEIDFQYMCSDCGSKFPNKTRLKDHINWEHLKNYIHKCEVCQKVFKSHTSLYLHRQVVHVKNGTEHLCDHCGKSFPNRTKLRSHAVAIHSGQSPYKCSLCSARFSWHSCLSRHMRKVH